MSYDLETIIGLSAWDITTGISKFEDLAKTHPALCKVELDDLKQAVMRLHQIIRALEAPHG